MEAFMKNTSSKLIKVLLTVFVLSLIMIFASSCGKKVNVYTVTFDLNGGTLQSGSTVQQVEEGMSAVAPSVVFGNKLLSWSDDFSNITQDTVITARWQNVWTVTFNLNGGTLVSGLITQTIPEGENAIPPVIKNGSKKYTWDSNYSNVHSDLVINAVWQSEYFNVHFNLNGGTLVSSAVNVLNQTILEGGTAVAPKAEKLGYSLSWDKDFSHVTANLTVNAIWTKREFYSEEVAKYASSRTATIYVEDILGNTVNGSGFFISADGKLVTCYHVIDMAKTISVTTSAGKYYDVRIIDFDTVNDIAVLKINRTGDFFTVNKSPASVGAHVYAYGSPLGLENTFTSGTISNASRKYGMTEYYQTDASISGGNSGGPLINAYGEVIGINAESFIYGNNLNLAIKISTLDKLKNNKNWTVEEYTKWFEEEASRSYSPQDEEGRFYYSLLNTYQVVTSVNCLGSGIFYGDYEEGYHDMYDYYWYDYDKINYNKYIEYLKSQGWDFYDEYRFDDSTSYVYCDSFCSTFIVLEIDNSYDFLDIIVAKYNPYEE